MRYFNILILFMIILWVGCNRSPDNPNKEEKDDHGHHHHDKGAHGGTILDSGSALHVELVHNEKEGKLSLYILKEDCTTPQNLDTAPIVNLKTKDGPKQLTANIVENNHAHYEVSDNILKEELAGRIAIDFEGKRYNIDIAHHEHDH